MGCEICGRNSCTSSFHSLEEQKTYDEIADPVKENMRNSLIKSIKRLKSINISEESSVEYIDIDEVIFIIDNY